MIVEQTYEFVNTATKEVLGETAVVNENLTNIVEIGRDIANAVGYDNFVGVLVDRIAKTMFYDRKYTGKTFNIERNSFEYGQILQKIRVGLSEATENESWKLEDGATYEENMFVKPDVETKYYNNKTSYKFQISIAKKQVKEAFTSAEAMDRFIAYIILQINNAIEVRKELMARQCIGNVVAELGYNSKAIPDGTYDTGVGKTYAINLLKRYEDSTGDTSLTKDTCIYSKEFLKFAVSEINVWKARMEDMSKLFNLSGVPTFSTSDTVRGVVHSDFKEKAKAYLYSDTFHKEDVLVDNVFDKINYLQGTGTDYSFSSTSLAYKKTASGHDFNDYGFIGLLYDRDALMICNELTEITSKEIKSANFTNYWFFVDASYYNDFNANTILFYVAKSA